MSGFLAILLALSASVQVPAAPATAPAKDTRIKAFCIDFNWGPGGINAFAGPGTFAQASPAQHVAWYKQLGANTIQTFCVSSVGYAWFQSDVAPVTPFMQGDFLKEITELGHQEGLRVMGYFCVGANTYWGWKHPELSYGTRNWPHIPLTNEYVDYLCASIRDALVKTDIDGFMLDWFFNRHWEEKQRPDWLEAEKLMFSELMGRPFPGKENLDEDTENEYHRRAVDRCWKRIRETAKAVKPDCILWLCCHDVTNPQIAGTRMVREVDWLMNENPDPTKLAAARAAAGDHARIIQCLCGWGPQHDPRKFLDDAGFRDVGLYGFAEPDPQTTLPPTAEQAMDPKLKGNAQNIDLMRKAFHEVR